MKDVAIIMCTYKRPERLRRTLELLNGQVGCGRINLFIWNNEPANKSQITKIADTYQGAITIRIHTSSRNIGGFGRFYYARQIADIYPFVIFIDDDVEMDTSAISTLISEYTPRSILSFHAFTFTSKYNYHRRAKALPFQRADYCGTGGMICDSSVFRHDAFFDCPEEYWFIEDVWLCYYASHVLHWKTQASAANFYLIEDGKNQFEGLDDKKSLFLRYLISQGWNIAAHRSIASRCLDTAYRMSPRLYKNLAHVISRLGAR